MNAITDSTNADIVTQLEVNESEPVFLLGCLGL